MFLWCLCGIIIVHDKCQRIFNFHFGRPKSLAVRWGPLFWTKSSKTLVAPLPYAWKSLIIFEVNRWEERKSCLSKLSPTLESSLDAAWAGMNQYWDTRGHHLYNHHWTLHCVNHVNRVNNVNPVNRVNNVNHVNRVNHINQHNHCYKLARQVVRMTLGMSATHQIFP